MFLMPGPPSLTYDESFACDAMCLKYRALSDAGFRQQAQKWVIAGSAGAVAKLGMKRVTMQYKRQKLGTTRT